MLLLLLLLLYIIIHWNVFLALPHPWHPCSFAPSLPPSLLREPRDSLECKFHPGRVHKARNSSERVETPKSNTETAAHPRKTHCVACQRQPTPGRTSYHCPTRRRRLLFFLSEIKIARTHALTRARKKAHTHASARTRPRHTCSPAHGHLGVSQTAKATKKQTSRVERESATALPCGDARHCAAHFQAGGEAVGRAHLEKTQNVARRRKRKPAPRHAAPWAQ